MYWSKENCSIIRIFFKFLKLFDGGDVFCLYDLVFYGNILGKFYGGNIVIIIFCVKGIGIWVFYFYFFEYFVM